jgi:mitochondrial fission protein ELM1
MMRGYTRLWKERFLGKKPLFIRAYWDTRAGHVKQTRGLVQALSELTPVEVTDVFLPGYGFRRSFFDWTIFIVSIFRSKRKIRSVEADLIIGTGSHTHIPMLLHQQKNMGKVVTCMTPDWALAKYMDLCFIPEHDSPQKADNIFITVGPPNTACNIHAHDPNQGLIVIGGVDKKTHHWNNEKIILQVRHVLETKTDIFWTVSTSPRTPGEMTSLLAMLDRDFSCMAFTPFEETPRGWIEEQYAKSEFAWVSADSVSMVYEALSAGCRVGVLSVEWKNKTSKLARAISLLEKNNKIVSFKTWQDTGVWPDHSGLNEAFRCAMEILGRWWPERL